VSVESILWTLSSSSSGKNTPRSLQVGLRSALEAKELLALKLFRYVFPAISELSSFVFLSADHPILVPLIFYSCICLIRPFLSWYSICVYSLRIYSSFDLKVFIVTGIEFLRRPWEYSVGRPDWSHIESNDCSTFHLILAKCLLDIDYFTLNALQFSIGPESIRRDPSLAEYLQFYIRLSRFFSSYAIALASLLQLFLDKNSQIFNLEHFHNEVQ